MKYLFFSPLVPSKREKNILVLLSLYIFWGKLQIFNRPLNSSFLKCSVESFLTGCFWESEILTRIRENSYAFCFFDIHNWKNSKGSSKKFQSHLIWQYWRILASAQLKYIQTALRNVDPLVLCKLKIQIHSFIWSSYIYEDRNN